MSETSAERLARLLALVPWLRAHDGVSIQQAADHFSVSADQLTTDLWQLIVCGIPGYGPDQLVDIQFWDDERIHVLDPITLHRPLRLTGEEAAALLVALRLLAQVPGEHERSTISSAIAKIEQAVAPAADIDIHTGIDPDVSDQVARAIAEGGGLEIQYASAHVDAITTRVIAPVSSFAIDGRVYVEAWCETAQAHRTFRMDRIAAARGADRPTVDAISEGISEGRVMTPGALPAASVQEAVVAVAPDAAWVWDSDAVTPDGSRTADGWATGRLPYASEGWLMRYVLGRGGSVVLVEPAHVRSRLAVEARQRVELLRAGRPSRG